MDKQEPVLIGICGLKGSGKSEVASRLASSLSAHRVRFAGPLKDMLRTLGLTEREIEGDLKELPCDKLCGKTPRHAMLTLGTEWGRELIGPAIWADAWQWRVEAALGIGANVVTEDLRFPNEHAALIKSGGIVLRVERPGVSLDDSHESERHALTMQADIVFLNEGRLEDIDAWVEHVFPDLLSIAIAQRTGSSA